MSMEMKKVDKNVRDLVHLMHIVVENQGIVKFSYAMLQKSGFKDRTVDEAVYILETMCDYNRLGYDGAVRRSFWPRESMECSMHLLMQTKSNGSLRSMITGRSLPRQTEKSKLR